MNCILILFSLAALAQAQMVLKFENLRSDAQSVPAYISFGGGGVLVGKNLANNAALVKGTAYKMSDLTAGVSLAQYVSGRIYVSLGSPLTTPVEGNGYAPNFDNPLLADYSTRWDKIEITFVPGDKGSAGGSNISSQDFFGIPLQISTTGSSQTPVKLNWRESTANVFQALGKLSNFALNSPQNSTGAIALGNNGVAVPGVTGSVIRVISPGSVAPVDGQGHTVYGSLASYVTYLRTGNRTNPGQPIVTRIAGHNGQVAGGAFQTYNLAATVTNTAYSIAGTSINPGDLVFDGTVNNGTGDAVTTIVVPASYLSDYGIYQANPAATVIRGADFNGIVAKVEADYFAALNFGFAGSNTPNPAALPASLLEDSPSWTWYGNNPDGIGQPKLPITNAFGFAQPSNTDRYNLYAAYLTGVSDTYGFAYNDRLQSPLASLGDGSTLTLSVLPDTPIFSSGQPSTFSIVNAASGGRVAPGSIAILSGELAVSAPIVAPGVGVPLPTTLSGLGVQFGKGTPAPLFSVAPTSAEIQIPWELEPNAEDMFVVSGRNGDSAPQPVQLARFAPAIFSIPGQSGPGQGLAQGQIYDAANRLLDNSNPAAVGSDVVIYCTGLGPVNGPPPTGTPTPLQPLHRTLVEPRVFIGGVAARVLYAGLTPGSVGLYQVNARVPKFGARGAAVEVVIKTAGAISNSVIIAVK